MKSKKGILLGSILALALYGAGNASVKAAEIDQASAYISKEAADALETAESADQIQTPELDLSGLYTVAGSTVVAGIGITSEFDFSEAETEKKQEEPDPASKEPESQAEMTEAAKDSAEASDRTGSTESSKPAETESADEAETETVLAAQQSISGTEKPKNTQTKKAEEVESSAENKIIQELQAEPAVTGDEMDVVPFLLMGAAAGLILSGDLIMKRKTEEDCNKTLFG